MRQSRVRRRDERVRSRKVKGDAREPLVRRRQRWEGSGGRHVKVKGQEERVRGQARLDE